MKTLILAHYYTTPDVQQIADYVGDSLDLALIAQREKADRIIFAGVKFMAETAKIINPNAEVILPDASSTCSLVTQTDIKQLERWRNRYPDHVHVSYINSSAEHKAISDWIVTSRNVDEVIKYIYSTNREVIFSPDRNMGAYLNYQYGYNMPVWNAVCEVHDQFKEDQISAALGAAAGASLIAHPESPLPVLKKADFVGSTKQMLSWIETYTGNKPVYVATEDGLLYNMRELRPDIDIRQAPVYSGCQCNSCPYMKRNTIELINQAREGTGFIIDYLDENLMVRARAPIQRMLDFSTRINTQRVA